jgi:hypothetical protein
MTPYFACLAVIIFPMAYQPDDASITPDSLAYLHSEEGQALRDQVHQLLEKHPDLPVNEIAKLRKRFPADHLHAGLAVGKLQLKARQKFPHLADSTIYAIPEALEQSTDFAVAQHKANRFAQQHPTRIFDLCAGIGGDTLALGQIAPTIAIDLSQARLTCLRYNLESAPTKFPIEIRNADVTSVHSEFRMLNSAFFHVDPARRSNGKRSAAFEDLIPGPDFLRQLIHESSGGAIKLSPAVDFDSLPEGHLEIISHDKSVVQAVLWTGALAREFPEDSRTATVFAKHKLLTTFTAQIQFDRPDQFSPPAPGAFQNLYEVDPAFTRANLAAPLAHSLNLHSLTDDAGYLADSLSPLITHPALTAFQIHAFIPYSEKNVIAHLQKNAPSIAAGPVEVKTRGRIPGIDTDRLQVLFSKNTEQRKTVLIFRYTETTWAVIASRI